MPKLGTNMTSVHFSTNTHRSLRTTVPIGLADVLKLKKGDILKWDIKIDGKNIYLVAKKVENGGKTK